MTYTPTREELEDLGFIEEKQYIMSYYARHYKQVMILYYMTANDWNINLTNYNAYQQVFPRSKSDIETLIRLLTNPNE